MALLNNEIPAPLFKHHGAKWTLAPKILPFFPQKYDVWAEAFAGALNLTLRSYPAANELAADTDLNITTFFSMLELRKDEFIHRAGCRPYHWRTFSNAWEYLHGFPVEYRDPMDWALHFYCYCFMSMSYSKVTDRLGVMRVIDKNAGGGGHIPARIFARTEHLEAIHRRLKNVQWLPDCWAIFNRVRAPGAVLYVDPVYLNSTVKAPGKLYNQDFGKTEQHERLLAVLAEHPARVYLSGYRSQLYDKFLLEGFGWRVFEIRTRDRAKNERVECLYLNPAAVAAVPAAELFTAGRGTQTKEFGGPNREKLARATRTTGKKHGVTQNAKLTN